MNDRSHILGIDGCSAGWVVSRLFADGDCALNVVTTIEALGSECAAGDLVCIDMPIGIPPDSQRVCDAKAKAVLGRYNARVFMTPPRPVVDQPDYPSANATSKRLIGKGLSKQMWNILPKVRALDALLQTRPALRNIIRECHPEIALWGLGRTIVASNKATPEGRADRLRVLGAHIRAPERCIEAARDTIKVRDAKDDDLIDAMICAVVGAGAWDGTIRALDEQLPRDATGLAMNIWYRDLQ